MTSARGWNVQEAAPERALPPGKVGYDLDASLLLLHTTQACEAFERLITRGVLHPDPALAEPGFGGAYEWMNRQMKERLLADGDGALWLWVRTTRAPSGMLPSCTRPGAPDLPGSARPGPAVTLR